MSKTKFVLILTKKGEEKVHIPNFRLKQIKGIKCFPIRQIRPEIGESLAEF